jgi:secreted trypsin-like serine protease
MIVWKNDSNLNFQGDSGGPVVYTFPDEIDVSLVGILSEYQMCPNAYPMSYTRVGPYHYWIKSTANRLLSG